MDKMKAIELLSLDMQDEHAALIQYLGQAYAIGEGDLSCEMEAIAREEMQHFRWLAEKIVALGGKPAMQRGVVTFGGPTVGDMMQVDVEAEERAINQYREHIAAIDDPDTAILLNRIIADENAHHGDFLKFKTKPDAATEVRAPSAPDPSTEQTVDFIQKDATHEYTVILQYLAHAFTTPHCEVEHEMEHAAIEEMRHLGWLAEAMAGLGPRTNMVHDPLELPAHTSEMLHVDIAVEEMVAAEYRRQADASEPDVATLFERLAGEEEHHIYIFNDLLDDVAQAEAAAKAAAKPTFTVGSLLGKTQK